MSDRDTIEFYRSWIERLLRVLFATAGFSPEGAAVARLPDSVQREIKRALLRLESATRRLIYYIEQRLPETPPKPEKPKRRSRYCHPNTLANQRKKRQENRRRAGVQRKVRAVVFWLFDRARYCPHTADPHRRPRRCGPGPRISCFDGSDPPREPVIEKPPRDKGDARKLCRRLQALFGALGDLEGQALRLRRLMEARKATPSKDRPANPIRDGAAPGYRYDGKGEEFELLRDCDALAKEDAPPPDV